VLLVKLRSSRITNITKIKLFSFQKEMAKRKKDCGLEDTVVEYLKKVKCDKTSKMFGIERPVESGHSKSLKKFMKFLKMNEAEKDHSAEDDLGFEINFGAFQPEARVSFLELLLEIS